MNYQFFYSMGIKSEYKEFIESHRFDKESLGCQKESRRWAKKLFDQFEDIRIKIHDGFFSYRKGNEFEEIETEGHTWLTLDGSIFDPTVEQFVPHPITTLEEISEDNYEDIDVFEYPDEVDFE